MASAEALAPCRLEGLDLPPAEEAWPGAAVKAREQSAAVEETQHGVTLVRADAGEWLERLPKRRRAAIDGESFGHGTQLLSLCGIASLETSAKGSICGFE